MSHEHEIHAGREYLGKLAEICRRLRDEEMRAVFGGGALEEFLQAIFDPTRVGDFPSIAEFFLANKHRSATIAGVRSGITKACAIKGTKGGTTGYVSPSEMQWFDDAVMFLEGSTPFEGLVAKYQKGHMSYAVAARDLDEGESVGPDDLLFVEIDDMKKQFEAQKAPPRHELEVPIRQLQELLDAGDSDEGKYQRLLEANPWVLGLQYTRVQRHDRLDDQNIPDFTCVRVSDQCRDIIEIKPPTMQVFRSDGEFTAPFNAAWNQCERYLSFAREEADYLRRKGLRFDNPICMLVCGHNLPKDERKRIRVKERLNPSLRVLTFNDLMAFMRQTVEFIVNVESNSADIC